MTHPSVSAMVETEKRITFKKRLKYYVKNIRRNCEIKIFLNASVMLTIKMYLLSQIIKQVNSS